ncbi:gibberellin 2-beta-dioxygenase 8-like [Andrographis paniculata]|uniref:gibberellin 2-beta-dioxygenase 8-like n=1 Tax=Andrographis paniculata TaxID=175694 RepID=UPI0021E76C6B|nr:gibberellin 2-beta-dioxygenase 8-like [Andrographis paniculata]XP_051136334.1 gibberellin 2-beta-dioxygenase 8-like [Andrographis paniculata]
MVVSVNDSEHLTQPIGMEESADPPFEETYKDLILSSFSSKSRKNILELSAVEECELPLIDLNQLNHLGESERQQCKKQIAEASREWGFFQVIHHGISCEVLERMREEQVKLFRKPFQEKMNYSDINFSTGSYRWGTPSATCLKQISWSEAFHVSLSDVLGLGGHTSLSSIMEQYAVLVSELSHKLMDILAEEMGQNSCFFKETCLPKTCYLRLNRYPACPIYPQVFGIMPHTDSDFITVLHQDNVGGLQLVRNGKWFAVKPNPQALIINIGDLFQAWSNGMYKSVEHRVVANPVVERFSAAYFFCPSVETVVESGADEPRVYRSFSFGEYRKQVQEDVKVFGYKIGLSRFLKHNL